MQYLFVPSCVTGWSRCRPRRRMVSCGRGESCHIPPSTWTSSNTLYRMRKSQRVWLVPPSAPFSNLSDVNKSFLLWTRFFLPQKRFWSKSNFDSTLIPFRSIKCLEVNSRKRFTFAENRRTKTEKIFQFLSDCLFEIIYFSTESESFCRRRKFLNAKISAFLQHRKKWIKKPNDKFPPKDFLLQF